MVDDFTAAVLELLPYLGKLAYRLSSGPDDREDLVQDTLERALRGRAHFDGRNLRGWLGTLMHNRAADLARRERLRQHVDLDSRYAQLVGGDVERQAIAHLELERILAAEADPVLRLSLLMSPAERARTLRLSQNRLSVRLRKARARARRDA